MNFARQFALRPRSNVFVGLKAPRVSLSRRNIFSDSPKRDKEWGDPHHHGAHFGHGGRDRPRRLFTLPFIVLGFMPMVCFGLGTWQIHRLKWKVNLIEELEDKLHRDPMALPRNINLTALPTFEYRKVRVQGEWDHAHTVLLGPRTHDSKHGYDVLTPLRRPQISGSTIIVNRGFVSRDLLQKDAAGLLARLAQETGQVEVVGLLRKNPEPSSWTPENHPEKGEWYWADVDALAEMAGGPNAGVQPVYIEAVFDGNTGEAGERLSQGLPIGRSANIELRNMHATYAVTWYSLAIATTIMFAFLVRNAKAKRHGLISEQFRKAST